MFSCLVSKGITEPAEAFFWPSAFLKKIHASNEGDESEDEMDEEESLTVGNPEGLSLRRN